MPGVWSLEGGLAKLQEHVQSRGADCARRMGLQGVANNSATSCLTPRVYVSL
jgi:hypothetical protein